MLGCLGFAMGTQAFNHVGVLTALALSEIVKLYGSKTPQRLILIDGERVTKLMVQYQVGVRVQRN